MEDILNNFYLDSNNYQLLYTVSCDIINSEGDAVSKGQDLDYLL